MLKVNQEDPYNINFKKASDATKDVQNLIVDGQAVWSKPYEVSQIVSVTTGSTPMIEAGGRTVYNGSASVDIGPNRKRVTVSMISISDTVTVTYNETTGIAVISVKSTSKNAKAKVTLKYWT